MATYQAPGVYVEEIDAGVKPLSAGATAVAAFVGFTERAPQGDDIAKEDPDAVVPRMITTWNEYQRLYGGFVDDATLPQSVFGYFQNGGSRCYIARVPHLDEDQDMTPFTTVAQDSSDPGDAGIGGGGSTLKITAAPGRPSGGLDVVISRGENERDEALEQAAADARQEAIKISETVTTDGAIDQGALDAQIEQAVAAEKAAMAAQSFTYVVKVRQNGSVLAARSNLTLETLAGMPMNAEDSTELITIEVEPGAADAPLQPGTYTLAPERKPQGASAAMFTGIDDETGRSGIMGLGAFEDITMVIVPDLHRTAEGKTDTETEIAWKTVQAAMVAHAEKHKNRIAILDSPPLRKTPTEVRKWRSEVAMIDSKFATLYYPWVQVGHPDGGLVSVPPSGHMAGVWARTDSEAGVWRAPANRTVSGVLDLDHNTTTAQQEILNPDGINCIRNFGTQGIRVWGARTLSSDTSWRYINVRRLFNMVEDAIRNGTAWVVFEPNDAGTWGRVRGSIDGFLRGLWRQGAFTGATPAEAYFIKCDAETNPPDVVDRGELVVEIGIAPVKPAEFVIFRVSQFQPNLPAS